MGIIHNECLDVVYNEMYKKKRVNKTKAMVIQNDELFKDTKLRTETAVKIGYNHLKTKYGEITRSTTDSEINLDELEKQKNNILENGIKSPDLSKRQLEFLNGILSDFMTIGVHDDLMSKIASWEETIITSEMTQEEKENVLSVLLIGKHSAMYWKDNWTKWTTLFNSQLISVNEAHNVKSTKALGDMHAVSDPTRYHMEEYTSQGSLVCLEYVCPNGLVFNQDILLCDYPEKVSTSPWQAIIEADLVGAASEVSNSSRWYDLLINAVLQSVIAGVTHI